MYNNNKPVTPILSIKYPKKKVTEMLPSLSVLSHRWIIMNRH